MQAINQNLVEIALERVGGADFERFFQAYYASLVGVEFVPLGGFHDGGADAFVGTGLFEGKEHRLGTFYQASIQEDHRAKIRHTVKRLREVGRQPTALQYITSRVVGMIDREEEYLSDKLNLHIKIRDRKWIANNINHSSQTITAYNTFLEPQLAFLRELGGATTIGESLHVPARTLCVFLGQEIQLRRGNTDLLEAVTDSLILWALEGTDPDQGLFMVREDIRIRIEEVLPSAKHFVRGVFDHRIEMMSQKGNPTGREIRWYRKEDKFCLPWETRKIVTTENAEDQSLKLKVLELYEYRAEEILDKEEELPPDQIAAIVHRALELTFEQQGLELAAFLTEEEQKDRNFTIADQVDGAIEELDLVGDDVVRAKEVALLILRRAFYHSTEDERLYYGKLSRTYTLMLTLRNEPKVVEYFKGMSSNFVLFVGSDIIVRALSERYLAEEDQMTVNMLRILKESGATLLVTHMTVEEVHSHIKITDREFREYILEIEPYVDKEITRHTGKILIRAYFNAKNDPLLDVRPAGWKMFIEQICNYSDLHKDFLSRDQVKNYLIEKFSLDFLDDSEINDVVDSIEVEQLADQIKAIKSEDVLAFNDARHILAVYGKRKELREEHRPNPYGYHTWWLTHETRVMQCTGDLVKQRGAKYIMRPEFILNFVALSPTTEMVRKSYSTIFPTLLGVRLSNRMREKVFHDVMTRAKDMRAVDEARAKVMVSDMSNQLKGDKYKQYEAEWLAAQPASGRSDGSATPETTA